MRAAIALALGLALTTTHASAQDDPKGDPVPEALLGSYLIVSAEESGEPVPAERVKGSKVRITPETIVTTNAEGTELYVAKFNLSTSDKPWKIAMTQTGGPRGVRGEHANGIIALDGENLRLAYTAGEGPAPATFRTEADKKQLAFVLKKVND